MTKEELLEKLDEIQASKCETQMLEIKAAEQGCPKRLYDTLSSFSNKENQRAMPSDGTRSTSIVDSSRKGRKVFRVC